MNQEEGKSLIGQEFEPTAHVEETHSVIAIYWFAGQKTGELDTLRSQNSPIRIGRSGVEGNQVLLKSKSASRYNGEFVYRQKKWYFEFSQAEPTNGVYKCLSNYDPSTEKYIIN